MKILNQISRLFAAILSLASAILFFFPFVQLVDSGATFDVSGAQLAFGSKLEIATGTADLLGSSYIMLCLVLAVFSAALAIFAFIKKNAKGAVVTSFVSALIAGIIMLVAVLSKVAKFVDYRPLQLAENAAYSSIVWVIVACLILSALLGIAGWLINDYLEVLASKNQKLSIIAKVKKFFREMIAEIKKIVWPSPKSVARNSVIVLIICAMLGAFIWIIDYLLGLLLNFIA